MDHIESDREAIPFPLTRFRKIFFVGVIGTIVSFTLFSKLRDNTESTATHQHASPESMLPELKPKGAVVSSSPFFPYDNAKHPVAEVAASSMLLAEDPSLMPEMTNEPTVTPNFAIQLIGFSDKKRVASFIETHQLSAQTQTVKTKRNGKDWYIVLYGEYGEREAALEAIQALPSTLKALNPWPRRLSYYSEVSS